MGVFFMLISNRSVGPLVLDFSNGPGMNRSLRSGTENFPLLFGFGQHSTSRHALFAPGAAPTTSPNGFNARDELGPPKGQGRVTGNTKRGFHLPNGKLESRFAVSRWTKTTTAKQVVTSSTVDFTVCNRF
jgi:hypothetical protein